MKRTRCFRTPCDAVFGGSASCLFSAVPLVLALALIWPFGGGTRISLMPGSRTPGARGSAIIKSGGNRNTRVDIRVHSLARPGSLSPAENAYVVWVEPPGEATQNVGQIAVNGKQKGDLHIHTPYKRFKLMITAEQNAQAQMPNGPTILSGTVAHR